MSGLVTNKQSDYPWVFHKSYVEGWFFAVLQNKLRHINNVKSFLSKNLFELGRVKAEVLRSALPTGAGESFFLEKRHTTK